MLLVICATYSLLKHSIKAVSPWQFKEMGGTQNWVQLSDTLWDYRWKQAINDVKPDIVEIVTWNDYAESHYIGDINPNVYLDSNVSQYVNGFVHAPWRIVADYYIKWYKNGSAPVVGVNAITVYFYKLGTNTCTPIRRIKSYSGTGAIPKAFLALRETGLEIPNTRLMQCLPSHY
jgi:hypothetical protein